MNIKYVIKKDNTIENFDFDKIFNAVKKSSDRVLYKFKKEDYDNLKKIFLDVCQDKETIGVNDIHNIVELSLDKINKEVAKSYRDYRNYKKEYKKMMKEVISKTQEIYFDIDDKENANTDASLISTKRTLSYNILNKELYKHFFLNVNELQACNDGYIYIHDMGARRDTFNCCLFDISNVLKGGFTLANRKYNEPKYLDTAFDVIADIVTSSAAQQYGGFTLPEIDKVLEPYAIKTYNYLKDKKMKQALEKFNSLLKIKLNKDQIELLEKEIEKDVDDEIERIFEQGFQAWEFKFNTISSSRGDFPFITVTMGLGTKKFEKMATKKLLEVRMEGQGEEGKKTPVLFPKIVFLYDENLHGKGKELEALFDLGIICSSKAMYPDWLSLTGDGYVADIYKKYNEVISPMGCRAFLSPWYEKGGMKPLNEEDKPIYVGRFNIGAISLNLPMIYQKSVLENKNFYNVLDYYLEMIRQLHIKTYNYLGELKASSNPLCFCEGGFYGGNLKPNEKIRDVLKYSTASFGITALNELQQLHNQHSLYEDGNFAIEVMEYINKKILEFKFEDNILYAIYGTPAESLCGTQVSQFRKKYGIIKNVSDKSYVSNSFHCHVSEDISPIEKQDSEKRFWDYFNGGKIQHSKYPINYNIDAIKTVVRRAMQFGFYEAVNLSLSYCENCGYEELDMDYCPKCNSKNIMRIDRMNGYLGYSRVNGNTKYNKSKMDEIKDRKSM